MTAISTDADRAAFLARIIAEPDEDTHRLVFADWLEEHGEPERAEFIRLQCRVAELDAEAMSAEDCEDARCAICAERRPLTERVRELFDRGTDAGSFLDVAPAAWGPCHWRRGFIERLDGITAADWVSVADALCWHPTQTAECPTCGGESRFWQPHTYCPGCRKENRGLVPRPCPPTAHPIRRVVLTTWPRIDPVAAGATIVGWRMHGRTLVRPALATAEHLRAEWPGVEFELPAGADAFGADTLAATIPTPPFPGPGWTVGGAATTPPVPYRLPAEGWRIEIVRQSSPEPEWFREQVASANLALRVDLRPGEDRPGRDLLGTRVGPLSAADTFGRRWRVESAVVDGVRYEVDSGGGRRLVVTARSAGRFDPAPAGSPPG